MESSDRVYATVRRFVFVDGQSRQEAARVFGLNRETVAKICPFSVPPGYRREKPPVPLRFAPTVAGHGTRGENALTFRPLIGGRSDRCSIRWKCGSGCDGREDDGIAPGASGAVVRGFSVDPDGRDQCAVTEEEAHVDVEFTDRFEQPGGAQRARLERREACLPREFCRWNGREPLQNRRRHDAGRLQRGDLPEHLGQCSRMTTPRIRRPNSGCVPK